MVHRGERVVRRQSEKLLAPGNEQRIGTDQKTARPLFHKSRKGGIDVAHLPHSITSLSARHPSRRKP
jgi:hypothetical protein